MVEGDDGFNNKANFVCYHYLLFYNKVYLLFTSFKILYKKLCSRYPLSTHYVKDSLLESGHAA